MESLKKVYTRTCSCDFFFEKFISFHLKYRSSIIILSWINLNFEWGLSSRYTLEIKGKKNSKRSTLDNEESSLKKKKKSKEKKVNIKSISNQKGKWKTYPFNFCFFILLFQHSR